MGRSAKIVRSTSFEKVKKMSKGQAWRYVHSVAHISLVYSFRESGARVIRLEKKSAKPSNQDVIRTGSSHMNDLSASRSYK
jgi:hypothetical protein